MTSSGGVRRARRIGGEEKEIRRRDGVRVLENAALVRDVPEIAVARVDLGGGRGHGNVVRGGVGERILAAADVPLAPRRDDGKLGSEGGVGELEAHLIVALAGASVRERVGADGARDVDLTLGDERTRHRRAEKILAAVDRAGAERGPDVVGDELLAHVLDEAFVGAGGDRLGANAFELVALPDVGGDADDLGVVPLAQPGNDDGSVEAPRVGERDFANHAVSAIEE